MLCALSRGMVTRAREIEEGLEKTRTGHAWPSEVSFEPAASACEEIRRGLEAWQSDVARQNAENLPSLVTIETIEGEPDWVAESVQRVFADCIAAIEKGDDELLSAVLPSAFFGALWAVDEHLRAGKRAGLSELMVSLRPLVELLEISGLTYLYAALRGNPTMWELIRASWDGWLARDGGTKLDYLAHVYELFELPDAVFGEGDTMFYWRRNVLDEVERLPYREVRVGRRAVGRVEFVHDDPEIAGLGREHMLPSISGRKVFARRYLIRRCDAGRWRKFGTD